MKKPPHPFVHIITVAEPLACYYQLSPKCGIILENSLHVWSVNLDFRAEAPQPLVKLCPICRGHSSDPPAAEEIPMYEYWIVDKRAWVAYLEARGKDAGEEEVA